MFRRILSAALLSVCIPLLGQTKWGKINYQGQPWVKNVSRPYNVKHGMEGRHVALWASHGRFYDLNKGRWRWQRPALFCTTEDLFTQTIVVPYLMPMLENAGAVVFSPRERDWQRHEVIVDNDKTTSNVAYKYEESYIKHKWETTSLRGFSMHKGHYTDQENPFEAGTARMAETTKNKKKLSTVTYQPRLPEAGRYAVYVSYQTLPQSIDDAHYTVWHQGQATEYHVNQQMGGSTWVYLGTFDFDAGSSERNCVVLSNLSNHDGIVTADAVRFGGGMGNIERGGEVSGMPRCLEGARYYAQWAGMPYNVYSCKSGANDYADDINVRSLMTNLLAGGSCYAPDSAGRKVPIELSLAVHSDAGYTETGQGVYGTLTICTTKHGDERLAAGISREASLDFAQALLNDIPADLQRKYGTWTTRKLYDRNYSETRLPIVPSAIIETLSHQNFGDMRYALDPNFRFTMARSIYKTMLRHINSHHGKQSVVSPLTPENFHIRFTGTPGEIRVQWSPVTEEGEPTSAPTGYVLYMAQDDKGFDNGTPLKGSSCNIKMMPGVLYSFRIAATNDGGISFPSEVLSALYDPEATSTVAIVNGFRRLSSPAISQFGLGFDMEEDPGITYGRTAGWLGRQRIFAPQQLGIEDSTGLGFSSNELEGKFIAGNDFNYVRTHADAIRKAGHFNIVSTSAQSLENGTNVLGSEVVADVILGLEKNDGHSLVAYKTFRPALWSALRQYTSRGGNLLVSGAYVGSDQRTLEEQNWLSFLLKCVPAGTCRNVSGQVKGLGTAFEFYSRLNEQHYAATQQDILMPSVAEAFPAMVYQDNNMSAAVAYQGRDYKAFTMGFPWECITDKQKRESIMRGILNFLTNK
ncbi:MAG: N-acetylmuramoyl-L-alanine amidase [Prevotella sp.]|nr:N-acetylmuramoyl-L-alanine amidase [Prevotella sp.]